MSWRSNEEANHQASFASFTAPVSRSTYCDTKKQAKSKKEISFWLECSLPFRWEVKVKADGSPRSNQAQTFLQSFPSAFVSLPPSLFPFPLVFIRQKAHPVHVEVEFSKVYTQFPSTHFSAPKALLWRRKNKIHSSPTRERTRTQTFFVAHSTPWLRNRTKMWSIIRERNFPPERSLPSLSDKLSLTRAGRSRQGGWEAFQIEERRKTILHYLVKSRNVFLFFDCVVISGIAAPTHTKAHRRRREKLLESRRGGWWKTLSCLCVGVRCVFFSWPK